MSRVPEFIVTLDRNGDEVGYVNADYLLGDQTDPDEPLGGYSDLDPRTWEPVVGGDLETVIGHMIPSYGFLPLGADPPREDEMPAVTVTRLADGTEVVHVD